MSLTADLKNFRPGDAERIALLGRALAAAFACGLLLSFKLWVSTRQYPLSPALGLLPAFAFPLDYLSLAALLALLGASAFAARPRPFLLSLLALSLLLCLQDQTRWQPWVYQYLFMLAALALHDGRGASDARRRAAVDACRLVVAGVYFWSGLQKLNANFFGEIWPWVVGPYAQHLPGAAGRGLSAAGILVPLAEVFVGVGLLTRRLRTTAVVLALATHAAVLALFAPLGRNAVVWPWNVASGVFVFVLFWRARETWRELLPARVWEFRSLAVVLFGLLPALNFFGLWDSYLSSSLYSGATARASVMLGDADAARLPPGVRAYVERNAEGREFVSLNRWAYGELNVPPYPEPRVARRIARRLCADAPGLVLVIQHAPKRLDGTRRVERLGCAEL